ncbi:MAG: hypothetical protein HY862_10890 [Chloroflexi bacterium]|nr:hypothetical protein [Chloroflexota bacterium]
MSNYVGTWGLYSWFRENGEHLLHPDERSDKAYENYYGRVFFCSGETEDGYLILDFASTQYRVRPDIYQVAPTPPFKFGDKVRYKTKPERVGIILGLNWHFKRGEPMYTLIIEGKRAKKIYYAADLELIEDD